MGSETKTRDEVKKDVKLPTYHVRQAVVTKSENSRESFYKLVDSLRSHNVPFKNGNSECIMLGGQGNHSVTKCGKFLRMTKPERKNVLFRACRCFNCLGKHTVKACIEDCNCCKCRNSEGTVKHFYVLHKLFENKNDSHKNSNTNELAKTFDKEKNHGNFLN